MNPKTIILNMISTSEFGLTTVRDDMEWSTIIHYYAKDTYNYRQK
jgi:hypothetical protein